LVEKLRKILSSVEISSKTDKNEKTLLCFYIKALRGKEKKL